MARSGRSGSWQLTLGTNRIPELCLFEQDVEVHVSVVGFDPLQRAPQISDASGREMEEAFRRFLAEPGRDHVERRQPADFRAQYFAARAARSTSP